jgi:DNA-binding NarL/FixJ family response regulator
MKRLVVIADHAFVVEAIRLALRQTVGFRVVGFLDGRRPLGARLAELGPEVVLVDDMRVPGAALDRLLEVSETLPDAKVLLLAGRMDDDALDRAFEAGAGAVLSKELHPIALGTLLRETVRGNVVHRHERARPPAEECPLTSREVQILGLAASGHTNGRIATSLNVTEQTVKFHLSNCYRKLGVANRTEASRYAFEHALVAPPERLAS